MISDLSDFDPELAGNYLTLVEVKNSVPIEQVIERSFTITLDMPDGQKQEFDLVEGGASKMLTEENKEEFVFLYIDYFLRQQCKRQLQMFKQGFTSIVKTINHTSVEDFRKEYISVELPGHVLKNHIAYEGKNPQVVEWFLDAYDSFSLHQKEEVLKFITGSSFVPFDIPKPFIKINVESETNDGHLPRSMTCDSLLYLPNYSSSAILKAKLELAILLSSEGFGNI